MNDDLYRSVFNSLDNNSLQRGINILNDGKDQTLIVWVGGTVCINANSQILTDVKAVKDVFIKTHLSWTIMRDCALDFTFCMGDRALQQLFTLCGNYYYQAPAVFSPLHKVLSFFLACSAVHHVHHPPPPLLDCAWLPFRILTASRASYTSLTPKV